MSSAKASVSGNLALDFLNTLHTGRGRAGDLLTTPQDLERWLAEAGLLAGRGILHPTDARLLLTEAHRLRADIGLLVEAYAQGRSLPETAVFGLNRVLAASATTLRVEAVRGGAARVVEEERSASLLAALAPVALTAGRLLGSVHASRVRRCASRECLLWFVDTSKAGRRRWCSMARCGNRAKAARHRGKRAAH